MSGLPITTDVEQIRKNLALIERGGMVRRYHTVSTISTETVAAHSYLVAWCVKFLSRGIPRPELLLAALQHDVAECITGDLPAPTKIGLNLSDQFERYEQDILANSEQEDYCSMLSEHESKVLKMADICGGLLFCIHERNLGNRYIRESYSNYRKYAESKKSGFPEEEALLSILDKKWEVANA